MFLQGENIGAGKRSKKELAVQKKASAIVTSLSSHKETKTHDRHISLDEAENIGLNVFRLEDDSTMQDMLLSVHHAYMLTFNNTPAAKIIESAHGKSFVLSIPTSGNN